MVALAWLIILTIYDTAALRRRRRRARPRHGPVVSDEFSMRWCDVHSSSLSVDVLEFQTNGKKNWDKLNIGKKGVLQMLQPESVLMRQTNKGTSLTI